MSKKLLLITCALFCWCFCFSQNYVLYGLTYAGGTGGYGTLFSYSISAGTESVLLNFNGSINGAKPYDNVVVNPNDGLLYGMASTGGAHNNGVLFSFDPISSKDSVHLAFDSIDGKGPEYGSMTYFNNMFYSMTLYGGKYNYGTLFSFDPVNNKDSVYYNFDTNGQAYYPAGLSLTPYSNGLMYGMTYAGGTYNRGTIISFDPVTGIYNVVVNLDTIQGIYPIEGALTVDPVNKLMYALTYQGGSAGLGTICRFDPVTGIDSAMINFAGANGSEPYGSLVYDTANALFYGMTSAGGTSSGGVVFSYDPVKNKDSTLFSFYGPNGAVPLGDLVLGPNNTLYGMTLYGGSSNLGVLFSYNTVTGKDTVLVNFTGSNGASPYGSLTLAKAPVITSVAANVNTGSLALYPNPMTSYTCIIPGSSGRHFADLDDITGRKISTVEFTGKQYTLYRNGLPAGVYLIKVYNDARELQAVSRLLIQ